MSEDVKPKYEKECTNQQLWKMVHERDEVIAKMSVAISAARCQLPYAGKLNSWAHDAMDEALDASKEILKGDSDGGR